MLECEIGDYEPSINFVRPKTTIGFIDMTRGITRFTLPQGRPQEEPNLVQTKLPEGESIDNSKVQNAFRSLGHVKDRPLTMKFGLSKGRDLSLYMTNDRFKNILQENQSELNMKTRNSSAKKGFTTSAHSSTIN